MWDNRNIAKSSRECPDCGAWLDNEGYGSNCGGYHEIICETCDYEPCDWSC